MGFAIAIVSSTNAIGAPNAPTFTIPPQQSSQPLELQELAGSLWADVGYATRAELPPEELHDGATLHAHVMAFNGVGLSVTASLTIVLDNTPPAFGAGALRLVSSGASDGERAGSFYVTGTTVTVVGNGSLVSDTLSSITAIDLVVHNEHMLELGRQGVPLDGAANLTLSVAPQEWHSAELYATAAGFVTSSPALRFLSDSTPPLQGEGRLCDGAGAALDVVVGGAAPALTNTSRVRLCVRGFGEPRSGISTHSVTLRDNSTGESFFEGALPPLPLLVAVNTAVGTDREGKVTAWQQLTLPPIALPCGRELILSSAAISGAGVGAPSLQHRLIVDCTAPEGGTVSLAALCVAPGTPNLLRWAGFVDGESGVTRYDMRVSTFYNGTISDVAHIPVHLKTVQVIETTRWASGTMVRLSIRACNAAGLCGPERASQVQLGVVAGAPKAGTVAWHRSGFMIDATFLAGNWSGFTHDSDIFPALNQRLVYDICVGTTPDGCQVVAPEPVARNTSWQKVVPPLVCGLEYFLLVRATSCTGEQTTVTSAGVVLCCEAPAQHDSFRSALRRADGSSFTHTQGGEDAIFSWAQFAEPCSGLASLRVRLDAVDRSYFRFWYVNISAIEMVLPAAEIADLADGSYKLHIEALSIAGLSASTSLTFVRDASPPELAAPLVSWSALHGAWLAPNNGSSTTKNGTPAVACVPASAAVLHLRIKVADRQARLETVEIAFAPVDNAELDRLQWHEVGLARDLTVSLNSAMAPPRNVRVVILARACNAARLCATSAPSVMLVRSTVVPAAGRVELRSRAAPPGFLARDSAAVVGWSGLEVARCPERCAAPNGAEASPGSFFYVGVSALLEAANLSPVTNSPVAIAAPLLCGHTYYATVRATSCGGLSRTVSSEGAKLCCAGPTGGPVEFASVGSAVRFATNVTQLEVRWGALSDSCSGGVESIEVGVEVDGVAAWASGPLAGANTSSVALPSGLAGKWAHGAVVRAVVNATSLAGVRSSLASTITVDLTPPVKGQVKLYIPHALVAFGQLATGDACISLEQARVTLRWTSVVDFESGIASCVLAPI